MAIENGLTETAQAGTKTLRPTAIMLSALDMPCSSMALQLISILAEDYLMHLSIQLHKYTSLQRRTRPSVRDVAFLLSAEGIFTSELEDEYDKSQFIFQPEAKTATMERDEMEEEREWAEQQKELARIVPTRRKKEDTAYIPSWMPPLPADHTYRSTAVYADRIVQPRDVREKILEEGKVVEEALRKLGGTGENESKIHLEEFEVEKSEENLGTEQQNGKRFDIVALALARSRRKKSLDHPVILHIGKKLKV